MTFFTVRRMLGPISTQMGGDSDPTGSGGGGGGSITINNNVEGYMLKATGLSNTVEGVPQLQWDSSTTTLSASANIYVSGSSNYYYLHGVDADGNNVKFKVAVQGSILQIAPP